MMARFEASFVTTSAFDDAAVLAKTAHANRVTRLHGGRQLGRHVRRILGESAVLKEESVDLAEWVDYEPPYDACRNGRSVQERLRRIWWRLILLRLRCC
jgi:hypothetical protein